MKINFSKYQGTGNDFILIDNRNNFFPKENLKKIIEICDRKFGIGSDGLVLIEKSDRADFEMIFFNPDGSKSLCGNGSRCAVKFAYGLQLIGTNCSFLAHDGLHNAFINGNIIGIEMRDVEWVETYPDFIFLNTGSPHVIVFTDGLENLDVKSEGRKIRNDVRFKSINGVNVNFINIKNEIIHIRTYERGVEDETLSCGTGVTAAVLAASHQNLVKSKCNVVTRGGNLMVDCINHNNRIFTDIILSGPAEFIFEGTIEI